jgi:peroxiredoxin (alkyl hydroperoxide reductase subunit C)
VVDQNLQISKNYDVLIGSDDYTDEGELVFTGEPKAYRGLFLIDKSGVVRHQLVNDLPLGRNVEEVLRLIDALQFTEKYGEVCPANWKKGEKSLKATQEGIASYLSEK